MNEGVRESKRVIMKMLALRTVCLQQKYPPSFFLHMAEVKSDLVPDTDVWKVTFLAGKIDICYFKDIGPSRCGIHGCHGTHLPLS